MNEKLLHRRTENLRFESRGLFTWRWDETACGRDERWDSHSNHAQLEIVPVIQKNIPQHLPD
jgi:hypothetical protein